MPNEAFERSVGEPRQTAYGLLEVLNARVGNGYATRIVIGGVPRVELASASDWFVHHEDFGPGRRRGRFLLQTNGPDRCTKYRVLELTSPKQLLLSGPFGNCEVMPATYAEGDDWIIVLGARDGPDAGAHEERWVWRGGRIEALGRRLRPEVLIEDAIDTVAGPLRLLRSSDETKVIFELGGRRVRESDSYSSLELGGRWPREGKARLIVLNIPVSAISEGVVLVELRPDGTLLTSELIGWVAHFPDETELRKHRVRQPIVEAEGGFKVALIDGGDLGWVRFRDGSARSASAKEFAGLAPAAK